MGDEKELTIGKYLKKDRFCHWVTGRVRHGSKIGGHDVTNDYCILLVSAIFQTDYKLPWNDSERCWTSWFSFKNGGLKSLETVGSQNIDGTASSRTKNFVPELHGPSIPSWCTKSLLRWVNKAKNLRHECESIMSTDGKGVLDKTIWWANEQQYRSIAILLRLQVAVLALMTASRDKCKKGD